MHTIEGLNDEINYYFINSRSEVNNLVVAYKACGNKERELNAVAYSHLGNLA